MNIDKLTPITSAAEDHDIAGGVGDWFERKVDGAVESISNAPSFAAVSVLSGVNQFYNSAISVGNWFGADLSENDTATWISDMDSNLGQYYEANKEAADITGFIAGSIVPGLGAVKLLNYGQAAMRAAELGRFGKGFELATGILAPSRVNYVKSAVAELKQAQSVFSLINANTAKALGTGAWQGVLEGAAAETFVQATMNASPVLDQQDAFDIAKNIAIGGVFGGAVEGVIGGAKTFYAVKKGVIDESIRRLPFMKRFLSEEGAYPSEKIILAAEDRDVLSGVPLPGSKVDEANLAARAAKSNNYMREQLHEMNIDKADVHFANYFADGILSQDYKSITENLAHGRGFARVYKDMPHEIGARQGFDTSAFITRYVDMDTGKVLSSMDGIGLSKADIDPKVLARNKVAQGNRFDLDPLAKDADISMLSHRYAAIMGSNRVITKMGDFDLPAIEKLLRLDDKAFSAAIDKLEIGRKDGLISAVGKADPKKPGATVISTKEDLQDLLIAKKQMLATKLAEQGKTQSEIAAALNMSEDFLAGKDIPKELAYFGDIDRLSRLNAIRSAKGMKEIDTSIWEVPRYVKVAYEFPSKDVQGLEDTLAFFKQKQKAFLDSRKNVYFTHVPEEIANNSIEIPEAVLNKAHAAGAGPGKATFANENYNTLEAHMAYVAQAETAPLKQHYRELTRDELQTPLLKLRTNPDATIEWSVINEKLANTREAYYYGVDENGRSFLSTRSATPDKIYFENAETAAVYRGHQNRTETRGMAKADISAVNGATTQLDTERVLAIKPDPKDYPYVGFVIDEAVAEGLPGHKSMVFASSEKELSDLMAKVPAKYKKVTKKEAEDFYKASQGFDWEESVHENFLNSELQSKGVYSRFFPRTDPEKIVDGILNYHLRHDNNTAVELVRTRHADAFRMLEDLGESYTRFEASKIGSSLERIEATAKNPYLDYVKLALDIQKKDDLKGFRDFSTLLDSHFSKIKAAITAAPAKTPADLDALNASLKKYGYHQATYDGVLAGLANHSAPKGELSKFVGRANALISKFTLGLDPLNALNNAVGANILRITELKSAMRELSPVAIPGTQAKMGSATKLMSGAVSDFFQDMEKGELRGFYKSLGTIKDQDQQFKAILDDFTLHGTESVREIETRLDRMLKAGEKYSGNVHAEEFNRFVSSRVAHKLAEQLGYNHEETRALITTFVNRVEGSILASQRPLIFQGPIGKAVGLFQSYQFNLIQQLLRHVGEGSAKDAAMLLGLQGSIYGMQGLPAFQLVNQHIVGNASGNKDHRDLYDAAITIADKEGAEFILYGAPSWFLGTNLYSRGDINPRHPTIIPTNVQDIPAVAMTSKFLGSMFGGLGNIAKGVPVTDSLLNALEHNGINRSMAGIATVLQGHSTTNSGKIISENDLMSLATISRIVGGRPMDEALVNDSLFRIKAYEGANRAKMTALNEVVRLQIQSGQSPSANQMEQFANMYAAAGGKQEQFAKYMMDMYKKANVPQSWEISHDLKAPLSQKVQGWMNE